ncbi:MAG: DUF5011 domain-containing protein [Chloroflexi bacterium]|nr:DUF5011 domain-containing protein [Chloroflexota bacterium]
MGAGSTYGDAGAAAWDNVDGDITANIVTGGLSEIDTNALGSYTVTYGVSDTSGHAATQVTRWVNVGATPCFYPPACGYRIRID